jgi:fused signal recognition particle receptor
MSFNWFDRNAANEAAPAPSDQPQAAEGDTPTSEEMLTFAKQAYENLKKQKAAAAGEAAVETPEAETLAVETPEAETPAEKPALYSPPPDDSGLPFWARADADREVRLARLRETAIETPEPNIESEPPRVRREIDPATLVPLDGDFLWSMEVLASQGRRADEVTLEEITWLKQLRQGLDRTRRSLVNQLKAIVGQGPLNDDAVMEIESLLLQADVGVAATDRIIGALQAKLKQEVLPPEKAIAYLKEQLINLLDEPIQNQTTKVFVPEKDQLNIWLLTGVNGVGKTTTIGKLTHIATKSGYRCLIAAADTFRAAAVEQVKVWGARSGVDVIANPGQNTDPAAVVFDAIAAAQSRNTELLLVDTAGRLQNKKNLMDELSKVRRIIDKKAPDAKIESLLVLDATLGQNGLQQAKVFAEAAQLSGVVLTKLDGTAKGGIALAVVQQLGLPIRFIGAGEGIEDLRPFSSYEFVEALISG